VALFLIKNFFMGYTMKHFLLKTCVAAFLFCGLLSLTGCMTTGEDGNESDIPWNNPADWEASPMVPGDLGNGY